ncbi:MAG: hypothetical protein EBR02_10555, partial [Alphaproteobacteria bacterium]|nr:hypothetical protein [Alphaproteobacteria bacterium]
MSISLRYTLYMILLVLGACAYNGQQSRENWDTVFADANACKGEACKKTADNDISAVAKGGKR